MTNNDPQWNNAEHWIRLLWMAVFAVLMTIARFLVVVISLLQFVLVAAHGEKNANLLQVSGSLNQWLLQGLRFLTFNSEEKPFPFADWPQPDYPSDYPDEGADAPEDPVITSHVEPEPLDEADFEETGKNQRAEHDDDTAPDADIPSFTDPDDRK